MVFLQTIFYKNEVFMDKNEIEMYKKQLEIINQNTKIEEKVTTNGFLKKENDFLLFLFIALLYILFCKYGFTFGTSEPISLNKLSILLFIVCLHFRFQDISSSL